MHGGSTSPNHNYKTLLELYFQNPQFGYYFLVVISQRLLQNVARLEGIVEQNNIEQNKIMQQAEISRRHGLSINLTESEGRGLCR